MAFDDSATNRLNVGHPGVALEVAGEPAAAIGLQLGPRVGVNNPIVEGAVLERDAGRMPPPYRVAVDHGDIAAEMFTVH